MELIPPFEFGILNAWIFMIWLVLSPILSNLIIKEKGVTKSIQTSAPMKYEKTLNVVSMGAVILGFIYSIFLPFDIYSIWFLIGLIIFIIGFIINLSVLRISKIR